MNYIRSCKYVRTLLVLLFLSECSGHTLDNVMDLHETLFVNSKYNRNIRGLVDQTGLVRVGANFSLITIGEVMEREEAFSVMGLLYLTWTDERLVWNVDDYNGTSELVVYQDIIWKPEVKLSNPLLSIHELGVERAQIRITNTGQVNWIIPDIYTATCKIDVVSFPLDRQYCSLDFIVSTYLTTEVIIEAESDHVGYFKFEDSQTWEVVKSTVVSQTDSVSKVMFWLCLERIPSFDFAVVLAPIGALSILNVFAFFVKVDSGERISFSITLLLSITLYLSMIPDKLPSHSKGMSAIIYCLNVVLAESMFICITSIYSMHVYHKQGAPSMTCQRVVMKLLGRGCGTVQHNDGESEASNTVIKLESADIVKDQGTDSNKNIGCGPDSMTDLGISWTDVSLVIDRAFSCLASLAIVCSFIVFAAFVKNSRTECK